MKINERKIRIELKDFIDRMRKRRSKSFKEDNIMLAVKVYIILWFTLCRKVIWFTLCIVLCIRLCIVVDPEDDFTFSASDEEDETQLARAIADDMGYFTKHILIRYNYCVIFDNGLTVKVP